MVDVDLRQRLDAIEQRLDAVVLTGSAETTEQLRADLERHTQARLDHGFAEMTATLERAMVRLFERDSAHITWTKDTARLVSKLRDDVLTGHQNKVVERLDALESLRAFLSDRDLTNLELSKQTALLVSRLRDEIVGSQDLLQSAVLEREARLVEHDKAQLEWARETARLISRMRDEILAGHQDTVAKRMDALQIALADRDKRQLEWLREIARLISELREHDLARVTAGLEGFDHRLTADLRARLAHQALEDARQSAPATSDGRAGEPDGVAEGGPMDSPVAARRFGLLQPTVHAELEGLLALGAWTADDPKTAVYLSRMGNDALRALYPSNERRLGMIACRSGLRLEADLSDIFAANVAFGWLQEADDFALFMSLVTPGATVIDVGANFGLYAAHAALHAGPDGRVVAFEPGPDTFALLSGNIARNGLADRCLCIQAAVAGKAGEADFNVAADSAFSGLRDTGRSRSLGVVKAEVVTLDGHPAVKGLAPVDLIKIDVEGGEGAVLAGARRLFARSPDLVAMLEFSHKNLDAAGRRKVTGELDRLANEGFAILSRAQDGGMATIGPDDLKDGRNENLFLCRPASPNMRRLQDMASSVPRRVITPSEAAALALLKRQASAGSPATAKT